MNTNNDIPLSSYHDPKTLPKLEINDSGDKRKKYWENFYKKKNSLKNENYENFENKENLTSYYEIPKKKSQNEIGKNSNPLGPVNLNKFVANDRRESWGFPVNLQSKNLQKKIFSKNEKKKENPKQSKISENLNFSQNSKNSENTKFSKENFQFQLQNIKTPFEDQESKNLFTLGSKPPSIDSKLNYLNNDQIFKKVENDSNFDLKNSLNSKILNKYSNNDPRIKSAFKIFTKEKLQKNGTTFTKIHCEGKNLISVANKANIFNFFFKENKKNFLKKSQKFENFKKNNFSEEKSEESRNWSKGIFVMHGNYQEVFGLWKLKNEGEEGDYLVLVKENGNVKLVDFCRKSMKNLRIATFCYNPFDYSNYRNSVVISEEITNIKKSNFIEENFEKSQKFQNFENLKESQKFQNSEEKIQILLLRETENKISLFKKSKKNYSKLGVTKFDPGLCIQSMFFISKNPKKGKNYAWFFFKNGMYSVESIKPFINPKEEKEKKAINLMKYSPREEKKNFSKENFFFERVVFPVAIPYFSSENSEIMSSLVTKDQKWFFLSVYQKVFNVNFLVLYKRNGAVLEFYSKLNVQNLQGTEDYISNLTQIELKNGMNKSNEKQPGDCYIMGFKSSPSVVYVFKVTKTNIQRVCAPIYLTKGKIVDVDDDKNGTVCILLQNNGIALIKKRKEKGEILEIEKSGKKFREPLIEKIVLEGVDCNGVLDVSYNAGVRESEYFLRGEGREKDKFRTPGRSRESRKSENSRRSRSLKNSQKMKKRQKSRKRGKNRSLRKSGNFQNSKNYDSKIDSSPQKVGRRSKEYHLKLSKRKSSVKKSSPLYKNKKSLQRKLDLNQSLSKKTKKSKSPKSQKKNFEGEIQRNLNSSFDSNSLKRTQKEMMEMNFDNEVKANNSPERNIHKIEKKKFLKKNSKNFSMCDDDFKSINDQISLQMSKYGQEKKFANYEKFSNFEENQKKNFLKEKNENCGNEVIGESRVLVRKKYYEEVEDNFNDSFLENQRRIRRMRYQKHQNKSVCCELI